MALRQDWEEFAKRIVAGEDGGATAAYLATHPKCRPSAAAAAASRLLRNVKVASRIKELRDKAAQGCILDARQTLEEVAKLAVANPAEYVIVGEDGEAKIDYAKVPWHAVAEIVTDETDLPGGVTKRKIKLKLYSRLDALEKLMKHHGQYESDNRQRGAADAGRVAEIIALMDKAARARR